MSAPAPAAPPPISASARLRIAVRLVAILLLLLACILPCYLWRLFGTHNPWSRIFLGGVTWIAGVEVSLVGDRSRKGAFMLANHISWIDIPAIGGATGAAFVAHDGLATIPVIRWLCALNDTVFVARHDRASVARQVAAVREAIRDTGALAIFPEGTTADGTELLPFKSSLLSALAPVPSGIVVQPLWLDYGPDATELAWVGDEPGFANFMRMMARARPIRLTVHFLPPIDGEALAHRKTIADAARNAILRAMQEGR